MGTKRTYSHEDSMVDGGPQRSSIYQHNTPNGANSRQNLLTPRTAMTPFRAQSVSEGAQMVPNPHHDLQLHQFGHNEMGRNYGGPSSAVSPAAARSTGHALPSGYSLQQSNVATQLSLGYSSTRVQLPPTQMPPTRQPFPTNPTFAIPNPTFGVANEAPQPVPMMPRMANSFNFQPQFQSTFRMRNYTWVTIEMNHEMQFQQVVGPTAGFPNIPIRGSPIQTQFPNTQQQQVLDHHSNYEMRASSSRNVRMRMTVEQDFQMDSSINQTGQSSMNRNPSESRIQNRVYDPAYALRGEPLDPFLRMFRRMNEEEHGE